MRRPARAVPGLILAAGMCAVSACALAACASTERAAAPVETRPAAPANPVAPIEPTAPSVTAETAGTAEAADGNPWRAPAREVLVHHCGQCHRSDLPTAVPRALAVFDLTRQAWDERMLPPQYDALMTRVRESSAFGSDEVASIEAFVRCVRDAECAPR